MAREIPSFNGIEELGITRNEGKLSNGSKLVVFERKGAPIYIRAAVFAGSRFDPAGLEGLAHFDEHMQVAGSRRFPTKDKLAGYIEQFGGSIGASTGPEIMSINSMIGEPSDLKASIKVMHEMLISPLFRPKTIETERGAILRELGDKKSNPGNMIWEVYRKLFFQGTEVGRSTLGSIDSISRIKREHLDQYKLNNLTSGRTAFIVSGDVKFEDVRKMAEDELLLPHSPKRNLPKDLSINRDKPVDIEPYPGMDQVHLAFGFRSASDQDPDNAVLNLIAEVLGGGRASALNRKLRLERGLVYAVAAWQLSFSDAGAWVIKTSTSKDKLDEVLSVVGDEIKRVVDNGLTPQEVLQAQKKIVKSNRLYLETSKDIVDWHETPELTGDNPIALKTFVENTLKVTPERTRDVAQKYFGQDKWYLGLCGDVKEDSVTINL